MLIILLVTVSNTFAQVGIGTNTPAASAALEITSITNNKGILIPRITSLQKDAISNPAEGLMIYQSSAPTGFYYYNGSAWKLMVTQTDLDVKVDKVNGKDLSSNDYTTAEKTKLASITGTNSGGQTTVTGNAGTATKLAAPVTINGVAFDGSSNITISTTTATTATTAGTVTTAAQPNITSVGTLGNLTVTNPIVGSITGNATTATNATTAGTVTTAAQPNITSVGTLGNLTVTNPIVGSITGNATTATTATTAGTVTTAAQPNITSVGTLGNLTVTAPIVGSITGNAATATTATTATSATTAVTAGTVTTAAQPNITSVGTLGNLTVTAPIVGSITGEAGTVITNANLTGPVTSVGNATAIANGVISNAMLANAAVANLTNTNSGDQTATTVANVAAGNIVATTVQTAINELDTEKANLASPIFTGAVTAPIFVGALTGNATTSTNVTGTVAVFNGGTGLSSTPSDGQIDIGNGTGFTRATLTQGTGISITNTSGAITIASTGGVAPGTIAGDMNYWNGSAWVRVPAGTNGQTLTFYNGAPVWNSEVYKVSSASKIWMDRNLGATQVAISSTDANAYGDLYQWGRGADGHQKRTSNTTTALSDTDLPGHGFFIISPNTPYDWLSTKNDNLWQGVNGINNPCPRGYRLPTEAEWNAERLSWTSQNNAAGAFASPLKLPMAGYRDLGGSGSLNNVGLYGYYWSSTVSGTFSRNLYFYNDNANMFTYMRALGFSVRCLKDSL